MESRAFEPPRWLRSPHVQTMFPAAPLYAPPRSHKVDLDEELRIPVDGGLLHARAWWQSEARPAVLLLHGIAGSQDSLCCLRAGVAMHRAGYHAVRLDLRGAGNSTPDAPALYHGGLTIDVEVAVRHLLQDARVTKVFILGFSGGGSIGLKLAGEWGEDAPAGVAAVASVSAPLDYLAVARRMDSLRNTLYRIHVLGGLIDRARAFANAHPERAHFRASNLDGVKRFRTYDDIIVVPKYGFDDVDHYYRAASSGPWLPKVRIPSMILHSKDDPMVPFSSVEPWFAAASPFVRTRTSRHGGHLGWVGGFDEASWVENWTTREALAFFAEHA